MSSGIYQIRNTLNGKRYIGSAKDFASRWSDHRTALRRGTHRNRHLQFAWKKYGEDDFVFEKLEEVARFDFLVPFEQRYIDYYSHLDPKCLYNISKVAGSQLGLKHSEETKEKLRLVWKNMSPEEARDLRGRMWQTRSHDFPEKTRKKMAEGQKNRKDRARKPRKGKRRNFKDPEATRKRMQEAQCRRFGIPEKGDRNKKRREAYKKARESREGICR